MDKIDDTISSLLYDGFGLCPDYKIVMVRGDITEFHTPSPLYSGEFIPMSYTIKLRNHSVQMSNGITLRAKFGVHHETKTIFIDIAKTEAGEVFGEAHYG